MQSPPIAWNAALYQNKHAFVWQHGAALLELLAPQAGEQILDLGCGTGQLTQQIAAAGATVIGIDQSPDMIEQARANYPHLDFRVADARSFTIDRPLDAVFSNATLHWIADADAVVDCLYRSLKPGGRFVAELGGKGNIQQIAAALTAVATEQGLNDATALPNWYFPSISDYATRLEQRGFEVVFAALFDRPTALQGETGIADWCQMFADRLFTDLSPAAKSAALEAIAARLRPSLYRDGVWYADYRRLRVIAIKPNA